jgi:hypothetical protein
MAHASINGEELAWIEFDCSIVQIDHEAALKREEGLVRIRMAVPVVRLGHDRDVYRVVIHVGNNVVFVISIRR